MRQKLTKIATIARLRARYRRLASKVYISKNLAPYLFLLPILGYFSLFILFPLGFPFVISFFKWNLIQPAKFIGVQNYLELFHHDLFYIAVKNTSIYMAYRLFVGIPISLGMALLVNTVIKEVNIRSKIVKYLSVTFAKGAYYIPVTVSMVIAAAIWKWIYNPSFGVLNYYLGKLGFGQISWLTDIALAFEAIVVMSLWKWMGLNFIIFLAGLLSIPGVYYEAADIDGASRWNKFIYITIPSLKPILAFVWLTVCIGSSLAFAQFYLLTEGGPLHSTYVMLLLIYDLAFERLRMGYASAVTSVFFIFLLVLTLIWLKFFRTEAYY